MSNVRPGDSWEEHMNLMDRWSEAGGTSNKRFSTPFLKKAKAMEKRLRDAGIPHPFDAE